MKKSEKKGILMLIVIWLSVLGIFLLVRNKSAQDALGEMPTDAIENKIVTEEFVKVLQDGTKYNTSEKLHETKKLDGLEISGLELTEIKNNTVILGTVKNTSKQKQGGFEVSITAIDKNKNEIVTVSNFIKELAPGESTTFNTSTGYDFANAYDLIITRKK